MRPVGAGRQAGAPQIREKTEGETRSALAPPWNVIVHNDPITLMTYVTMVLRKLFGYPQEKAQRLMMEVHTTGRSVVWTGAREQAEFYVQQLHSYQLLATMEQVDE